jgi:uncharacterized protein (TIGR03503 family)
MKQSGLLFSILLLLLNISPLCAAPVDDIRIVVDVSGSMVRTDPKNLRIPAMRMINGLIPSGANAGVWTFGRYVNMEVKWGKVDDNWRKEADLGVAKIHSRGQFTNIESALERASSSWTKTDRNSRRNIILLTDGKVDISKVPEKNDASRNNILNKTLPQLVNKGVTVHTIALSGYSDEQLLKQIAVKTSGSFEIANSADDLQRIFLRMFERAAKPDTVPLSDNTFSVDKSIREMTLLIFRKGDKITKLIQPDGKSQSQASHTANVNWRNDLGYDLITVKKPLAGKWTLDAELDPDNRVMIVTDLKLVVNELPAFLTPDQPLNLKVELQSNNKRISKKSFLKFVEFSVTHTVGEDSQKTHLEFKHTTDIAEKGIYHHQISAPLKEGKHELLVSADARIFDRSRRFIFEVQWPLKVDITKGKNPGEFELSIKAREEYIIPQSLQLEVVLKRPDGLQKPLEMLQENDLWKSQVLATELDGLHQVLVNMKAKSVHGQMVDHRLDGYSVLGVKIEPEVMTTANIVDTVAGNESDLDSSLEQSGAVSAETEGDLFTSIMIILLVNVGVIVLALGAYFYLRRNKSNTVDLNLFDDNVTQQEEAEAR